MTHPLRYLIPYIAAGVLLLPLYCATATLAIPFMVVSRLTDAYIALGKSWRLR